MTTNNDKKRFPAWVLSFAMFPLGLGAVILGGPDILEGHRSLQWTPTPAVILSINKRPAVLAPAQVDIRYQYADQGRLHVSNRMWAGNLINVLPVLDRGFIRNLLTDFVVGQNVMVYVNPLNAGESAFLAGPRRAIQWMSFCVGMLLIGVWAPMTLERWLNSK